MMTLLAAVSLAVAPPLRCSIQHPTACDWVGELVTSRGFERALRRFIGTGRADWYEHNADRTQQLLSILQGPSGDPVVVNPTLLRFGACYPHVCNIRAVVFISTSGVIQGAAMLYPDCPGETCSGSEGMRLTILRDPAHPEVASLAHAWGETDVASINSTFPFAAETLGRVEVIDVPEQAARRR